MSNYSDIDAKMNRDQVIPTRFVSDHGICFELVLEHIWTGLFGMKTYNDASIQRFIDFSCT